MAEVKKLPVIEFSNSYGNTNYINHGLTKDIGKVHITKTKTAPGAHKCSLNDWVVLHYKGWDSKGMVIADSRAKRNNHEAYFKVGHYQMSKCWDIAI